MVHATLNAQTICSQTNASTYRPELSKHERHECA